MLTGLSVLTPLSCYALSRVLRQDGDAENGRVTSADEPEEGEDHMPDLGDDLALEAIPREVMPDLQPVLPNCACGRWLDRPCQPVYLSRLLT